MYEGGLGVSKNSVLALQWLKLVANAASPESSTKLRNNALQHSQALTAKMARSKSPRSRKEPITS